MRIDIELFLYGVETLDFRWCVKMWSFSSCKNMRLLVLMSVHFVGKSVLFLLVRFAMQIQLECTDVPPCTNTTLTVSFSCNSAS